ncbi:hypothetical protein [Marinobacter sp. SS21]|uniref:hypothetical protein n=1 Tax=Marinobacter sp. SS21 TaxID=2979460 RepID=UPI00232E4955|nr:hypothetical protein [Marinobacter sp. SS21]MDC0663872.1 hypothetical protein [Marinobacter sp. SS21]
MKKLALVLVVLSGLAGCQDRVIWDDNGVLDNSTQNREIWNSNGKMDSGERTIWRDASGKEVIK